MYILYVCIYIIPVYIIHIYTVLIYIISNKLYTCNYCAHFINEEKCIGRFISNLFPCSLFQWHHLSSRALLSPLPHLFPSSCLLDSFNRARPYDIQPAFWDYIIHSLTF